ncbi:hypothetical protein JCM6882_003484, partial [Rhodosporidiobolus microsporus]
MSTKLFVGNLSWSTTSDTLRTAFEEYGEVVDCMVVTDAQTGRTRGFGFVSFADEESADSAVGGMHDQEF